MSTKSRIAITATAITATMGLVTQTSQAAIVGGDVVAYWQFEDAAASTTATDWTGNGNNASLIDDSTATSTFGGSGISGQAWITTDDGASWAGQKSDYLTVGTAATKQEGAGAFAVTGWMNISVLNPGDAGNPGTGNNHFFDTDRGGASNGYRLSIIAGNQGQVPSLTFTTKDEDSSSSTTTIDTGFDGFATDEWYFVAGSYDGTDGTVILAPISQPWASRFENSGTFSNTVGTSSRDLALGRIGGAGGFNGLRDEHAIFNRALTGVELQSIFEGGVMGNGLDVVIPEPGTAMLLALGGLVAAAARRRMQRDD